MVLEQRADDRKERFQGILDGLSIGNDREELLEQECRGRRVLRLDAEREEIVGIGQDSRGFGGLVIPMMVPGWARRPRSWRRSGLKSSLSDRRLDEILQEPGDVYRRPTVGD